MSTRPGKTSFFRELGFGLVLSLAAGAIGLTLSVVFGPAAAIRAVVAGIGLVYVVRTLARSSEATGRVTIVLVWAVAAGGAWFLEVGLAAYVVLHVGMVWLVRSLYAYSRLTEAALDLGLSTLAVSFALWALVRTESVFLAVWCFSLVQAMHVAIPGLAARVLGPGDEAPVGVDANRGFTSALNAADEALQRMAARR